MRKLSILLSAFIIISSMGSNHINNYKGSDANVLKELRKQYIVTPTKKEIISEEDKSIFKVTSYDNKSTK